ncbi:MAG TPA: hypothetical protein V6D47_06805, partial [Oscillatoriaceae cyanobacterium]
RIAPTGAYNRGRSNWRMGEGDNDRRDFGRRGNWNQPGVPSPINGFGDNFQRGNGNFGYGNRGRMPMPLPMPTPINGGFNGGYNGGYNPGMPFQPMPMPSPIGYNQGGFFSDLWNGFKNGLSSDVQDGMHPIQTIGNVLRDPGSVVRPYTTAIQWGHPGWALGRLAANVGVVGGLVLGGRALLGAGAGAAGGAGVGTAGSGIFSKIGGFFSGIFSKIGSFFSSGASVGVQ